MSGPLLNLISQGVRLWLYSVCDELQHLNLQLQGSALAMLGGSLEGAKLEAKGVVFQSLAIAAVELQSEPISFDLKQLLKGQDLKLNKRFRIHGKVEFSGEGLNKSLANPHWLDFSNNLATILFGNSKLKSYEISENKLTLHSIQGEFINCSLDIRNGELWLTPIAETKSKAIQVPLDSAIRLEELSINEQNLTLSGSSIVSAKSAELK
jgi:hypothetical protein